MNKLDFLRRLDKELSVLEKEERRELLAFYEERFYTGTIYENKTEEQVCAELESPETIARNILAEYGVSPKYVKSSEERYSNLSSSRIVILLLFDLFIATWLIPTLFSAALSILGSSFTWFGSLSLLIGERTTVDEFMFAFLTAGYVLLFLFGLVVLGASIFATKTIVVWHLNTFKIKGREKWMKRLSNISMDGWFKRHRGWNRIKNLALVASLVTIVYTGLWIFNHYDWVEAEYGGGEVQVDTITEVFTSEITEGSDWDIVTDFENMDVQIVLTDGDEVSVIHKYYEDDKFTYDFDYTNNVLTMTSEYENRFVWNFPAIFGLLTQEYSVRIEVPSSLNLGVADITTANGEVDLRNVDFDTIDILTTNGEIEVSDVNLVDDILIHTTNGTIIVKNITVSGNGTIDLQTTNGSIDVENTNFKEYYLKSTNGTIDLDQLNVDLQDGVELIAETTNGSIHLDEVYVDDVTLETTNGDISFYNDDTTFIPTHFDRDTTNGEITTNVR